MDEKYFRRVDKFEGDQTKFRSWLFDFQVATQQVDPKLGRAIDYLIKEDKSFMIIKDEMLVSYSFCSEHNQLLLNLFLSACTSLQFSDITYYFLIV